MKPLLPDAPPSRAAMASALAATVTEWGTRAPTAVERESLAAICRHVLETDLDLDAADPVPKPALAQGDPDPERRLFTLRLCLALAMVNGSLSPAQLANLERLAATYGVDISDEAALLRLALARRYRWLLARITRRAASDYWAKGGRPKLKDWLEVAEQGFFSGVILRPQVAARYRALARHPEGTLGRAIYEFFDGHGYAFPGEKGGTPEHFMLHECTHVLSGYDTDPTGEMLVTAFTAGAKKRHVMDWVFVSFLQWHFGASVGSFTVDCSHKGLLEPEAFFHAWARGMRMRLSLMDDPWHWWDVIDEPVAELRHRYGIPALAVQQLRH